MTPELTVEPAGVVLVCPHGRLLAHGAEDGCIRAHEVDVDASIKLFICRGQRSAGNPTSSHPPTFFNCQPQTWLVATRQPRATAWDHSRGFWRLALVCNHNLHLCWARCLASWSRQGWQSRNPAAGGSSCSIPPAHSLCPAQEAPAPGRHRTHLLMQRRCLLWGRRNISPCPTPACLAPGRRYNPGEGSK